VTSFAVRSRPLRRGRPWPDPGERSPQLIAIFPFEARPASKFQREEFAVPAEERPRLLPSARSCMAAWMRNPATNAPTREHVDTWPIGLPPHAKAAPTNPSSSAPQPRAVRQGPQSAISIHPGRRQALTRPVLFLFSFLPRLGRGRRSSAITRRKARNWGKIPLLQKRRAYLARRPIRAGKRFPPPPPPPFLACARAEWIRRGRFLND